MTTLSPDTVFHRFRIVRLLGRGGMADVYEAEDLQLGRTVALKVLPEVFARDEERAERFAREVRASATLNHPNIVSVFEVGEHEGLHFYTMSLLTGGDLKARMKQGPLSPEEAIAILRELAAALGYAHDNGFVHRDVKPENVLFYEGGGAVLTDFGIARAIGSGTRMTGTGMSIGTPHYMSPEQARGRDVDGRSDLYALGVLFYEMLTGKVPFDAQDSFAVGLMHINEAPPALPEEMTRYQPVLDRLLAKEPDDRFQTGQALIEALAEAEAPPIPARPGRAITRVIGATDQLMRASADKRGESTRSRSGLFWGLGGAGLAGVLGIGLYLWQTSAPSPAPLGGSSTVARSVPSSQRVAEAEEVKHAGEVFRDCADCPEMVVIPAGHFTMGSPLNEPERNSDEGPQRTVNVAVFALGTKELTFAQWDACVADGGCNRLADVVGGSGNRHVITLSWNDAQEYVKWLSRKTAEEYRLPSEAEWEYAARAGTSTRFHTGNCITSDQANFSGTNPAQGCPRGEYREGTVPVGSFAPNAFGLHDMHGNVSEWVQDCWNESYNGAPSDGSAWMSGDCGSAVLRGGHWGAGGARLRSAERHGLPRDNSRSRYSIFITGFRVARSVMPASSPETIPEPPTSQPDPVAPPAATRGEADLIRTVQDHLNRLGYQVPISGELDPRTEAGIRAFEQKRGLLVTGAVDEVLKTNLTEAYAEIDRQAWDAARRADTEQAYRDYAEAHPQGRSIDQIQQRITAVRERLAAEAEAAARQRELVSNIQRELNRLGRSITVDGSFGPATAEAIRAFERASERPQRGEATEALLASLRSAERWPAPQPGDAFRDCPDCPEMVMIPAGRFMMGSPLNEPERSRDEGPQRTVNIAVFALGMKELTFAQWDACVVDGGCNHRPDDEGWGRGNRPVINVSWNDAQEYLTWLSRKTGEDYRLPSEAEWEYAARAGTTTRFHTGNCITTDQANFDGRRPAQGCPRGNYRGRTLPVGSFALNAFGLHDMHGNVWEWVQDCWNWNYNGAPDNGSAWVSGNCALAVLRGSSWISYSGGLRSAVRFRFARGTRTNNYGFRVARTVSL